MTPYAAVPAPNPPLCLHLLASQSDQKLFNRVHCLLILVATRRNKPLIELPPLCDRRMAGVRPAAGLVAVGVRLITLIGQQPWRAEPKKGDWVGTFAAGAYA